jgi:hypothetical protein
LDIYHSDENPNKKLVLKSEVIAVNLPNNMIQKLLELVCGRTFGGAG